MAAEATTRWLWRLRSLRVRAAAIVVLVTLSPLLLVYGASRVEHGLAGRMQAGLRLAAAEAAEVLARGPGVPAAELDQVALRSGVRLRVVSPDGAKLFEADRDADGGPLLSLGARFFGPDGAPSPRLFDESQGPLPLRPESAAARAGAAQVGCRTSVGGKLLVCHAARWAPGRSGPVLVYAQESSRRAIRALYDLRYQLAKLTLLLLPLSLLLGWWLGWRLVRPLELLRRQVLDNLARAAPQAALELQRRDEFGDLAAAFNALLARLAERSKDNEAFVADLAHEFKNPVAAVRACAEALEGGPADQARAARLGQVLSESGRRLDVLLVQFLDLARAEAGLPGEERTTVEVGALVRGLAASLGADERYRGVLLSVEVTGDAAVPCAAAHLESALRNLLDNAASFAGTGGQVRALVARDGAEVLIEISDTGPGIQKEHLPRVFDRFFTTRGARRGSGLGLALVRAVVEAHGGTVAAESPPGQGAVLRLRLPAAG